MAIRVAAIATGVAFQDTGSTTLSAGINSAVTSIGVASTTTFKQGGGIFRIDSELISYTGVSGGNTFTGCTRGMYSTTAAAHLISATVTEREIIKAVDMNDTFNAMYNNIAANPAFNLNSTLYTTYDDWEAYSLGNFAGSATWTAGTVVEGGSATGTLTVISSSLVTGTANKVLDVEAHWGGGGTGAAHITFNSLTMTAAKHIFIPVLYAMQSSNGYSMTCELSLDGVTYYTVMSFAGTGASSSNISIPSNILVVSLGSSTYDIYSGGNKIASAITAASPQLYFKVGTASSNSSARSDVYIGDVRRSTY
jgi:hypothetical protein